MSQHALTVAFFGFCFVAMQEHPSPPAKERTVKSPPKRAVGESHQENDFLETHHEGPGADVGVDVGRFLTGTGTMTIPDLLGTTTDKCTHSPGRDEEPHTHHATANCEVVSGITIEMKSFPEGRGVYNAEVSAKIVENCDGTETVLHDMVIKLKVEWKAAGAPTVTATGGTVKRSKIGAVAHGLFEGGGEANLWHEDKATPKHECDFAKSVVLTPPPSAN